MDKQLFAKIGVFVLLGLNVGAYYVFWPSPQGASKTEAKGPREEKGEAMLLPSKSDRPTDVGKPKTLPATAFKDAIPVSLPSSPRLPEQEVKAEDAVNKLLDHIKKETEGAKVVIPPPMLVFPEDQKTVVPEKVDPPAFPPLLEDVKPKPLPPLQGDPLKKDPNIGVTSALTPKLPSPWLFSLEMQGNQSVLTARLQFPGTERPVAEFRILCDRVERTPTGDVQAVGKVTFAGAGMKGACQRLTVPLQEVRLLFEEQASIVQDLNAGSTLRGDRMVWELEGETRPPKLGAPK